MVVTRIGCCRTMSLCRCNSGKPRKAFMKKQSLMC